MLVLSGQAKWVVDVLAIALNKTYISTVLFHMYKILVYYQLNTNDHYNYLIK